MGVDPRVIRFFEFAFAISGTLFSPLYPLTKKVIKKLFEWSPGLKNLIDQTAADALGNIVLEARGRITFRINSKEELEQLIDDWKEMGIESISRDEVFLAILNKPTIRQKILKGNVKIKYLLNAIFPDYCSVFPLLELDEHEKREYEMFQQKIKEKAIINARDEDIEKLIEEENNNSKYYIGRNYRLTSLLKKKHNYECQICKELEKGNIPREEKEKVEIEAHHLIPLEEGGDDVSDNIIIVCSKHHKMFHEKKLNFVMHGDEIIITFENGKKLKIPKN